MDRVTIPFIPPPRHCPEEDEHPVCDLQECTDSCDSHRQLCCQNTCGSRICVDGELPQSPCTDTVNGLTGGALLGQYVPQCNDQTGAFKNLQCRSHYCWCVDPQTGEPYSDMKESGNIGELECTREYILMRKTCIVKRGTSPSNSEYISGSAHIPVHM